MFAGMEKSIDFIVYVLVGTPYEEYKRYPIRDSIVMGTYPVATLPY